MVEEPLITIPNIEETQEEYNKPSSNLLKKNKSQIESIWIENDQKRFTQKFEKKWSIIFDNDKMYDQLEDQIRQDINNNELEMIVVTQTVIAN